MFRRLLGFRGVPGPDQPWRRRRAWAFILLVLVVFFGSGVVGFMALLSCLVVVCSESLGFGGIEEELLLLC